MGSSRIVRGAFRRTGLRTVKETKQEVDGDKSAYLQIFADEQELLAGTKPTASDLEQLFEIRVFRYFMARLKQHQNDMVTQLSQCEVEEFLAFKGRVKGLKAALGFPLTLYDQAKVREGPEPDDDKEELDTEDFPDFQPEPGVANEGETE